MGWRTIPQLYYPSGLLAKASAHQRQELEALGFNIETIPRIAAPMIQERERDNTKAIERAAGIYAVVKMRMFAECLLIEGLEDLSELAQEALKRLLQLPRFKGTARTCRRVYKQTGAGAAKKKGSAKR